MCISEAACKPQDRASKAKSLMGIRAHAVLQDSHAFTHTYNYTHTQSCTRTACACQSHSYSDTCLQNLCCDSSRGHAYMNMQRETGRTKRDKDLIYRERMREENTAKCPHFLTNARSQRKGKNETEVGKRCD